MMDWEAVYTLLRVEELARQHANQYKNLLIAVRAELAILNDEAKVEVPDGAGSEAEGLSGVDNHKEHNDGA